MPLTQRRRSVAALLVAVAVGACSNAATAAPSVPSSTAPAIPSPAASATRTPAATPAASATSAPEQPFDATGIALELEPVVGIPGAPLAITAPNDGSGRLFVTERGGRIWTVRDGQRSELPFLDIATRVTAGGESGLLGMALSPDFPDDRRLWVYYTNKDRDQVVSLFQLHEDDPDRADPGSEHEILRMEDFAGNHNGGQLAFGPDGLLYIGTGDGGGAGDPEGTGQRLDTLLGKVLRIDARQPTTAAGYSVPGDNPFVDTEGALPEIWHLGLRNPWRFSFDRATGDLWIGDVGQGEWEEIDVARSGVGGLNFGWSVTEGSHCFRDEGCSTDGLTAPVTEYSHDFGCSVTGGVVYRGAAWPSLRGGYLFADYCSGLAWAIDAASESVPEPTVVAETGRAISAFGEDEAGEVYATDLAGELLRVVVR